MHMHRLTDTTSRSPRQAQIDCSRESIVGAYSKLIARMPDDRITVSAICSTAGVGRQTFYRHFKNKKDVFAYRIDLGYDIFCEQLRQLPRSSLTLDVILEKAFEFWRQYQTVLNPLARSSDLSHWFMEKFSQIWHGIAREFLPVSDSNQYDIEFQIAGIAGVFLHWLNRDMKESPEEITRCIMTLLDHHNLNHRH